MINDLNPFKAPTDQRAVIRYVVQLKTAKDATFSRLLLVGITVPRFLGVLRVRSMLNAKVNEYLRYAFPRSHEDIQPTVLGRVGMVMPYSGQDNHKTRLYVCRIHDRGRPIHLFLMEAPIPPENLKNKFKERFERACFDYTKQRFPNLIGVGISVFGFIEQEL